jgi:hypothetical protein
MSFLKKLFGGGKAESPPEAAKTIDYQGYLVRATPFKENDRYQVCGVISREIDGVLKEEKFIRADASPVFEDAVEMTFFKARQIIDLRGGEMPK